MPAILQGSGIARAHETARLKAEGVSFGNDIVTGPGGQPILVQDPSRHLVEHSSLPPAALNREPAPTFIRPTM